MGVKASRARTTHSFSGRKSSWTCIELQALHNYEFDSHAINFESVEDRLVKSNRLPMLRRTRGSKNRSEKLQPSTILRNWPTHVRGDKYLSADFEYFRFNSDVNELNWTPNCCTPCRAIRESYSPREIVVLKNSGWIHVAYCRPELLPSTELAGEIRSIWLSWL